VISRAASPALSEDPMNRMRFDLDGIPLDDEDGRTTAILRFRTISGLVLALPESVDVTVPFSDLESAAIDLVTGRIHLRFSEAGRKRHPWLGAAMVLTGPWTDRSELATPPAQAPAASAAAAKR
jgi:hypothetical protein